jgi:3-deoxy-D-manno-octulosonic-acid transferase/heptosyltransferase-1
VDADSLRSREFRRILLIKLSAFGDVVHTLPVLHELRRRYPDARIDWLTKPVNAPLIHDHPALDGVIAFPDAEWRQPFGAGRRPLAALVTLAKALRGGHHDLVVDLQGQFRSALCALFTGAPVRIGFDRPRREVRAATGRDLPRGARENAWAGAREGAWLAYTHRIPLESLDVHAVDRNLRLGLLLGFEPQPPDFSFPIADDVTVRAMALLREHGMNEPPGTRGLVLIAPGTVWETKRWAVAGFAAVARHFLASGMDVALVGATRDRSECHAVAGLAPGVADLCGRTSLIELAALTRRATVVVANDSGPMHLAAALGRPTIALFGPTDPLRLGPYGQADGAVSSGEPCAPCYLRTLRQCPHGHACMQGIAADDVIARAESMMSQARAIAL